MLSMCRAEIGSSLKPAGPSLAAALAMAGRGTASTSAAATAAAAPPSGDAPKPSHVFDEHDTIVGSYTPGKDRSPHAAPVCLGPAAYSGSPHFAAAPLTLLRTLAGQPADRSSPGPLSYAAQ